MVLADIERIVSVSSEDPDYPARNLLKAGPLGSSKVMWKCKNPGERQISVMFQLVESYRITRIDVENDNSAFVEVFVARSSVPDDLKNILASSCLMTVSEAKFSRNTDKVRIFDGEDLCSDVAAETWDRVKVVCSQPFNFERTYGLRFIGFHVQSVELCPTVLKTNNLIEKDPVELSGFPRTDDSTNRGLTAAAAARLLMVTSPRSIKLPSASRVKKIMDGVQPIRESPQSVNSDDDRLSSNPSSSSTRSVSRPSQHCRNPTKKRRAVTTPPKLFHRLLEGVVIVISGVQNPLRSDLRKKASAMGAKYKADWDNSCTHLICAFTNTPKYQSVRGRGKIVTKQWIEECYSKRKRLPWRRFALATIDKTRPESDDEIEEKVAPPVIDHRKTLIDSDSSAEEEYR